MSMTASFNRRALLLATAGAAFLPRSAALAQDSAMPRPFRIDVPQATIDRILSRVRGARWPARLDATDWRYGANWDYMKSPRSTASSRGSVTPDGRRGSTRRIGVMALTGTT
jgi:hypothetical protein